MLRSFSDKSTRKQVVLLPHAPTTPTDTPVGANDNNVDLRKETMAAMQSVFQYQIVSRAVSDRLDNLKTAAAAF